MFYVRVTDDEGQVAVGAPGYWHHIDASMFAAVKSLRGEPTPVTKAGYDLLRAVCLHGERCANDPAY